MAWMPSYRLRSALKLQNSWCALSRQRCRVFCLRPESFLGHQAIDEFQRLGRVHNGLHQLLWVYMVDRHGLRPVCHRLRDTCPALEKLSWQQATWAGLLVCRCHLTCGLKVNEGSHMYWNDANLLRSEFHYAWECTKRVWRQVGDVGRWVHDRGRGWGKKRFTTERVGIRMSSLYERVMRPYPREEEVTQRPEDQ
jgi:hypothetical protein